MKFIKPNNPVELPTLELSERNLRVLLAKLRDPSSACTLGDPDGNIWVKAVPDSEHYSDRPAGYMAHEPITDEELATN